ncbi:glycosyltransferase family 61 protein [Actibacterium pelagium]|uniref:Glycosyltransferase 61 catalytic domain-containing protein n=1 Tax=Actibacterium pelagium TaxID=2029103 RepID=A0A917AIG1_9RHOB|nr:glycosyltransferase 61 family protein [Actibacterium pelagium]GGE55692.1 hypothetical protein GCM10011517_24150 [Actibacterium pelagium]
MEDPTQAPMPEGGWSTKIVELSDARVYPPEISHLRQPAGVAHSNGDYCPEGALWRGWHPITTEPETPTPTAKLSGRWLWGGVMWVHFGHFLAESTSRLWALDHINGPIDGILFIPKRPKLGEKVQGFQQRFIELMGCDLPIKVVAEPTQVEELIVPGQGFGLGRLSAGTEPFRNAIHHRFGHDIAPDGPEKIYLSRSALQLGKGSVLGELQLERHLREHGYEIFHPQKHSMDTQIARYKAAKQVIAVDGSALHMFAMVGRPDQQVGMIHRRSSKVAEGLERHLASFMGRDPDVFSCLDAEWAPKAKATSSRKSFGELNLKDLSKGLIEKGFIDGDRLWPEMTLEERNMLFQAKGLTGENAYVKVGAEDVERERIREMRRVRRARRAAEADQKD